MYPVVADIEQHRGFAVIIENRENIPKYDKSGMLMSDLFTQLGYECKMIKPNNNKRVRVKG